ncbi:MAG TPA: ABC transporter transmembrane domain-containing protein [Gemmatimonadaceae bacterium]|jgi:subfamily B ATP-binding cassette protein MsbA|nr:ABC transporter transmembrane domain-containing protein [Gemmatimonadaceae bacterium]
MYRRLLGFLRPHWWRMVGNVACNVIAAALDAFSFTLLIPFLNALFHQPDLLPKASGWVAELQRRTVGTLLDPNHPQRSLGWMIVIIMAIVAVKNVFVWLAGQFGASLQEYVTRDMRDAVFRHMQRLPLGFFHRTKVGQIISRVLSDTDQTKTVVTEIVTRTIQNAAQIVTTIAVLMAMNLKLTLLSLIVAPLLTVALQPLLRRLRRGYRRTRSDFGDATSILQEVVSGVRLVKSFGGEAYEDRRFGDASHRFSEGMVRINRVSALSQPLTEVIGMSIAVLILWIGAVDVLTGRGMDAASLIVFMTLVMRLLPPLKQLSQAPNAAQSAFASAERLFEILDLPTEPQADRGTRAISRFDDRIAFESVTFAYETEPVLRDVTFEARKGSVVALVGASGAGKSTLVDLIPRFYVPTAGRITLDGLDTRDITLASLRSLTGIVSQDTVLFNDTVRNNIAYGAGHRYSDEQIQAAARAANAHEFILALPQAYDTVLGERGTRLSGGQRQRIAIARALLVDPPILILDEATSALDTESERLVQEAVDRLLTGRTVFVIAHRLSTVTHADQILVLERGRIVERGTHQELLAERGAYFRLHSLQFRDERSERIPANV